MKLSIIIPAYNVEKYISRCLNSIFSQDVDTSLYEVICINDGSTDGTERIIKELKPCYANFKFISRENRGLSITRNEGLELSTGDLIWYVDSDDAVSPDSIERIISYFDIYPKADFLIFDDIHYFEFDEKCEYIVSWAKKPLRKNIYEKPLDRVMANYYLKSAICQIFIYKRDFLLKNNLFFVPKILFEDDEIRMRVFFFANEVRYIPYAHYIYTMMREGSITKNNSIPSKKSIRCSEFIIANWIRFLNEHNQKASDRHFINDFIYRRYQFLISLKSAPRDTEAYSVYKLKNKDWKKAYIKSFYNSRYFFSCSLIEYVRFICALVCPDMLKYISISALIRLMKRR